ncbi:elongation factor G [Nocardioides cynanchi]|uniref:elongation factor G n=1 Tax=Nocardioides cynanchi TaxID=2558918 RepID=UPI001248C1FF|nr:TetM/TetW/TetO/TetS family tetracycline resistance ribosomal protection protein [Nocardioides cynanchi]
MPARTLNLGILAHVDAGKTTLTERLLHHAGVIRDLGSVDSGTTQTDTLALERRRGITIRAAVVAFPLDGATVNVIDTPGHPDFIAEVERSLAVLDGAVLVVSAVEGVQPQTRVLMRALRRLGVPTLVFVNKVDRSGADPDRVLAAVADRLAPRLVSMGTVTAAGSRAAGFTSYRPDDVAFRSRLLDLLADDSDALVAEYVHDGQVTERHLNDELAAQVAAARLHPVFFGSAATGAGVPELMDGIGRLLPGTAPDGTGPASGRVFKVERGEAGDKVAYLRMFAGSVGVRQRLDLPDGRLGKVAGIQLFESGRWVRAGSVGAGQIGRVTGLAAVRVGDVFGDRSAADDHHFAPPTLEAAVTAVRPEQGPALRAALAALADQDPLIDARSDEAGGVVVSLYGRVQQEVLAATLAEEYGVEAAFADASVLHVERPRGRGEAVVRLNTDENPYQATIGLRIEPGRPGSGLRFVIAAPARDMPLYLFRSAEAFGAALEAHVRRELARGRHGWEVTDAVVTLVEVAYSTADGPPSKRGPTSTSLDYRKVAPVVARRALDRARTVVCEPVLRIRLEVPVETTPALQRLLGRWGAEQSDQSSSGSFAILEALLPAARLHELQRRLPDLTGGEGVLESAFAGYQPVPGRPPQRAGGAAGSRTVVAG